MTIVVTGSAGHLGEALMRTLRAADRPALGIDLRPSPFTDRVGSINDRGFVGECLRGARAVVHCANLHKPHVSTRADEDFLITNAAGTLLLLETSVDAGIEAFVYTSTTSVFGSALTPRAGEPAAWITEDVAPIPKNIYGATKQAAETLCELYGRRRRVPTIVLRTSRFFPEADDDPQVAAAYDVANAQVNELLYRRVDIEDVVSAHLLALERAPALGFARYIVSATTPFTRSDAAALREDAPAVAHRLFPDYEAVYAKPAGACSRRSIASTTAGPPSPSSAGGRNTISVARSTVSPPGRTSAARSPGRSASRAITAADAGRRCRLRLAAPLA